MDENLPREPESLWRKVGRPATFENPDSLWKSCCGYFAWVDENPLYEEKAFAYQGLVTTASLRKMRAMTIEAMCLFIGISYQTWRNYCHRDEFLEVTSRVEAVIRSQKFEGAAAELLNPNIIARDLGLADKSQLDHRSSDGSMTPKPTVIELVAPVLGNDDSAP